MTWSPYTLGGASNAPATGTTLAFTISHAVAAGDALVVSAASDTLAETVTSVTDSQGNTWTSVASDYNQSDGLEVFVCLNAVAMTSGVDTITATFSGSAGSHTILGRGCAGIGTALAVDVAIVNDAGSGTAPTSGASGTLRQASEWALAFLVNGNGGGSPTAWTGGFTAALTEHATSNQYHTVADQVTAATTALTAGATIVSSQWAMALVTLRAGPYLAGSNAFSSGSTTSAVTVGAAGGSSGVAAGDAVVVVCGVGSSTVAPTSVTDSHSQTYALVASEVGGNGMASYVYAAYNSVALTSGVDTVTVTWNSTSNNKLVLLAGVPGVATSAAFDVAAGAAGTGTAPSSGATAALAGSGEPSIGVIVGGSASVSDTPSTPWVQLGATLHVSGGVYMAVGRQAAPSTSGVSATGALGASAAWAALAAAFQLASAGSYVNGASGLTALSITNATPLPAGTLGVAYSDQLTATGGVPPYTWAVSAGALPAGLSLASGSGGGGGADFTYVGANAGPQGNPTIAQLRSTNAVIGPIGCVKYFYSAGGSGIYTGYLGGDISGGSWSTADAGTPGYSPATITTAIPGVLINISWGAKMSAAAISQFVASIPHTVREVGFSFQSEPENAYALGAGATFVADWNDQAIKIQAAQATTPVRLTLITSSYEGHYQDGTLTNGSFIPPARYVDVYGLDFYDRHVYWVGADMSTNRAWTVWTGLVRGLGKPLALTEFGISGTTSDAQQNARLQADWGYLRTAFGSGGSMSQSPLYIWLAWETDGTSTTVVNNRNQMGAATQATWAGIAATAGTQTGTVSTGTGGLISGTPTATGAASFTARVTDSAAATATKAFNLTINAASALAVATTSPLPGATINAAYSVNLAASGGTPPYTWAVTVGAPPTGLALSSGGTLSGTPSVAGTTSATYQVTDSLAATATASLAITVSTALTVTTTSLPAGQTGNPYTATLTAANGTTPYTWSIAASSPSVLPDGLALDPVTGIISGTPTVSGSFTLKFTVIDDAAASATSTAMTLAIAPGTGLPAIGRRQFGGGRADWGFQVSGVTVQIAAAVTWQFYTAVTGGSQYTDLTTLGGSPISSITTDSNGFAPAFLGPAGVLEMWADSNGGAGPRYLITSTNYGALLTTLHDFLKTLTG